MVLDLFAGTGAMAFEALSRGAKVAVLVERARPVAKAIEKSARELGLSDRVRVVNADLAREPTVWLRALDAPASLVFLDPPYEAWERDRRVDQGLAAIRSVLAEDGVLVVKRPVRDGPWQRPGFELLRRVEVASTAYEILSPSPLPDANDGDRQGADGDGRS